MGDAASGRRAVPHTADLRIEAWAPTREDCVAQAVLGTVESFASVSQPAPGTTHRFRVPESSDEDLLVAVLDELVYVVDVTGGVPVTVDVHALPDGAAEVSFGMVGADRVEQVGAPPKAVSLHELRIVRRDDGWWCSVTLDV